MLDEYYRCEGKGPVTQHRQQIVDDGFENMAAAIREGESSGRQESTPYKARYGDEMLPEELD